MSNSHRLILICHCVTYDQPERKEMKLSDAFQVSMKEPSLELKVIQLNISPGHNRELLEKCPLLEQYSQYVCRVQEYVQETSLDEAVERAVKECIREGILAEFLQRNRAEAIEVSIFEYDEERELALLRKEEREGAKEELRETVKEEVREEVRGEVREEIREEVREEIREEIREEVREEIKIEQICEKLRKNMIPDKIAEELEMDTDFVHNICYIAASYGPEYDSHKIYEAVNDRI